MNRKLLLSNSRFPNKFISSSVSPPTTLSKQQYMEEKVIESINNYNPKLKISNIEYLNIQDQFPDIKFLGIYCGVIVEDIEIVESKKEVYIKKQYFVWESNNNYYARQIVMYVFIADLQNVGRNTFSQAFFPELIDFMNLYKSSPSFLITNHPIYFINFESTNYPDSIVKQVAGLIASGIEYIEVFHVNSNSNLTCIPKDIVQYLSKFENGFNHSIPSYSSDFFEIDMINKITKIKTDKLVVGKGLIIKPNGVYDFNGSSEKFYWMEILPIIFLSINNGYKIDYTLLENFYTLNQPLFSSKSDKIKKFIYFIQFIKKIVLGVSK